MQNVRRRDRRSVSVGWSPAWLPTGGTMKQQTFISCHFDCFSSESSKVLLTFSRWLSLCVAGPVRLFFNTHKTKRGKEKWWRTQDQKMSAVSFSSSPCFQSHWCIWWSSHATAERVRVYLRIRPLALLLLSTERGGTEGYSLSMSLYFFLSMDTWSLNRTGSSLIWEWTRGMVPNQLANLFMQVWRWAKWSGSAQRDPREPWGCKQRERRSPTKLIMTQTTFNSHSLM